MTRRVLFTALFVCCAAQVFAEDQKAKPTNDQDDPIGRKISERIGAWPHARDNRDAWKTEYARLTVDEKVRYCIFELRNEDWLEFDFNWSYEPYSAEPKWQPRHELIKLGRAAIPHLLLALDSEVPTKAYPSRHMRKPWLVRDAAMNAIENIACRHFADNTELRELSDRDEKDRAKLRNRVADWWEKNKGFDEVHWAKEALLAEPTTYFDTYGAGPRWWAAVDSLYNRLGKESNPLLAEAYLRIPKLMKVSEAQQVKLDLLQRFLKAPTANVKSVFANALRDESLWVRIDGASGLWAIGDQSGLEPMVKEAEILANGRGSPQFLTDEKGSFIDTGESELDYEFHNLVHFLVECNTSASHEAVYKCLRGKNPYLREKAINVVPSLHIEKAVRGLPELFDDPYLLNRSRPIGDLAAETFAKCVPDCPRFDGATASSQQQSVEKIKRWWKDNGPKLKWDEKRGVLVLRKKLKSNPVAAIRSALPKGWVILKTEEDASPPLRPEGKGKAIYFYSPQQKVEVMQDKASVVYVMPADYKDGGEDPTHGQAQKYPAVLILTTSAAKVYLLGNETPFSATGWPTLKDDILKAIVEQE